jgi:hypothetical protein
LTLNYKFIIIIFMGFNKRFVVLEHSINALNKGDLKGYYGKSDMLIFEDTTSSRIYNLYKEGKTEEEILLIINQNMEEKTNEVY